jgi:sugar phosphate permease
MLEQAAAASTRTSTRPSRGRWYILLIISIMYLITYLDRVNISTAAPLISKEFGFDKVTMGFIFSAFVWAYAMFQVPGGCLTSSAPAACSPASSPIGRS